VGPNHLTTLKWYLGRFEAMTAVSDPDDKEIVGSMIPHEAAIVRLGEDGPRWRAGGLARRHHRSAEVPVAVPPEIQA